MGLLSEPGKLEVLLGNEAIARGAIEAGLDVAAAYPGTPSTEIGEALSAAAREVGFHFEWAANEKVATEVAAAAAWSGLRSMAFMKHVGVNVAADAVFTLAYAGVVGGMVFVSADDPHAHSSQNEQDNRLLLRAINLPTVEPADPQEAKDFTRSAFDLSEEYGLPFALRTTTRVSHVRAPVVLGPIRERRGKGRFSPDPPRRYVQVGRLARAHHRELLEKLSRIREEVAEGGEFLRVEGQPGAELGIMTSGVSYNYVWEAVRRLGVEAQIMKLGMTNPLPEGRISDFLREVDTLLVVEELEPVLEADAARLAKEANPDLRIVGKFSGHLPRVGELDPVSVTAAVAEAAGVEFSPPSRGTGAGIDLPPRPPVMCPACPHRATGFALKRVAGRAAFMNDIGCYALLFQKPFELADVTHAMGSSVGFANGLSVATDRQVVALIGDSTFFHAGIPALINAIHHGRKFLLVVMDNRTTAMTGHQPHPGTDLDALGREAFPLDIERVVRGLGVENVWVVDPYDFEETQKAIKEAMGRDGVSVIISRRECALLTVGRLRREGKKIVPYRVDPDRCTHCLVCVKTYACPAFVDTGEKVRIDPAVCFGCGSCVDVCPFQAIVPQEGSLDWRRDGYGV